MKYIVWRTPYKSYDYPQGDGYFVRWKNKCADEFSPNWFEANAYKSIASAINRLGLEINDKMKNIDDFFNYNKLKIDYVRNNSINQILDCQESIILTFERGHIDKIDDKNNFLGNAGEEILEYVNKKIEENSGKNLKLTKKFENLGLSNYIDNSISDEDFYK